MKCWNRSLINNHCLDNLISFMANSLVL